ncbi:FCD domain-containing protein [Paenibacillus anseongense]|uniref:FCD domain-containing protein n=1 Tax=Paenibacillus anseongense TaxID=2682845 RepID=UPI002DBF5A60|nr:FCD domain-containing protein [Paenibacillus anseongense]MEC0270078.1 FCD domain-containing protein [Paenibacillus anseongense]
MRKIPYWLWSPEILLQGFLAIAVGFHPQKNYERFFELDEEFHRTIIIGCGKTHTWNMLKQMNVHYNRVRILRLADDEDWSLILEQHQGIILAIREKNLDRAEKMMSGHLTGLELL